MNIEEFHQHCMAVAGAEVGLPFLHHNILVFKVMGKMFCMAPLEPKDGVMRADLKCNPERSVELRERYAGITPGHVATTLLWNRITLDSDVPDSLIIELIGHSVDEVVRNMPKSRRMEYDRQALGWMTNEQLWQLFPVEVVPHNPRWASLYEREKRVIEKRLGPAATVRINHIGSTAVAGLAAKPTIDILLEIDPATDLQTLRSALEGLGYIHSPQPGKPAPHMMYMKGYTPRGFEGQPYHLHIRYPGEWEEIGFRDYLRSHPDEAARYAALKEQLAAQYRHDRDAYTLAKSHFVNHINELARKLAHKDDRS